MERTGPQLNAACERAPVNGSNATPFSQQTVVLTKQAHIELKWKANYWQALYERLLKREAALKAKVAAHEATIRDLKQRLYGKKSEQSAGPEHGGASKPTSPRKRGQQPGSPGHGRSDRSALPVVTEVHDLSEEAKHCSACGAAFLPFPGTEASDIMDQRGLRQFHQGVRKRWWKWLNRRSQRSKLRWENFHQLLKQYPLPQAKIVHRTLPRSEPLFPRSRMP